MLNLDQIIKDAFKSTDLTTSATINGVKFTLGASSSKDEFILADILAGADDPDDAVAILSSVRTRTIASMIKAVNDKNIEAEIKTGVGEETIERAKYLLEQMGEWPASLVTNLYMICTDLKKKIRSNVRSSVEYDWFGENLFEKEDKAEEAEMERIREEEDNMRKQSVKDVAVPLSAEEEREESSFNVPADADSIVPDVSLNILDEPQA